MSSFSNQPSASSSFTDALRSIAARHANGEAVPALVVEAALRMLLFVEQDNDPATARMIATLTAQLELPPPIVHELRRLSRDATHRLHGFPFDTTFPAAPATTTTTPAADPSATTIPVVGKTRSGTKRAHAEPATTTQSTAEDSRPQPRRRGRPKGTGKVTYEAAEVACRGCTARNIQCHAPVSGNAEACQECAQRKTRCSFADEKGMQVESTGESEEISEVVTTGPQGSPKKPRLRLDSVTKVDVPPRPRPKGKGKATAPADVPPVAQGPSAAHSSNPPPVAPSPAVSLLELGPEVFPVSRTPSSDHSLLSLLPRTDQSAEQISRLARSVIELREQSLAMRESSLRLREETAELRRGVDDVRRQQLELRGAVEEVREEIRRLRTEQGNVVMDLGLLRSHSQVSFRTLQEETQALDRRLAVVEESLGLSERPPGTEGSPEVEEDAHGSTPGSSAS
ncbi:hypothetical protein GLOTRDRAFT_134669 [Gloeophyllum trabeum ATCC 11539]|uniref:Zn(2)-C6 fungal-type domain-containing protein n=1 Tax=Gloeophyllum trabeum (strain ATCC 11539 / FP-39264 / Madison 617) TaxID=670483 RepID=S7PQJ7_GLOTA|nr:uncharacterized protein GLOTRDRAFT_134669 [Gloeophyllum trabeum ATCC 11539]EPQ49743.1 hypothetical protein GLOTRDRAFT_134669 [Gloeophyllum trabeum ATCC 11539]